VEVAGFAALCADGDIWILAERRHGNLIPLCCTSETQKYLLLFTSAEKAEEYKGGANIASTWGPVKLADGKFQRCLNAIIHDGVEIGMIDRNPFSYKIPVVLMIRQTLAQARPVFAVRESPVAPAAAGKDDPLGLRSGNRLRAVCMYLSIGMQPATVEWLETDGMDQLLEGPYAAMGIQGIPECRKLYGGSYDDLSSDGALDFDKLSIAAQRLRNETSSNAVGFAIGEAQLRNETRVGLLVLFAISGNSPLHRDRQIL
jgi:hypothetical protein